MKLPAYTKQLFACATMAAVATGFASIGCGSSLAITGDAGSNTGDSGSNTGDSGFNAGDTGVDSGDGGTVTLPGKCTDIANALSASLDVTGNRGCSVTVRLDYTSRAVLGYQMICGPITATTEASARATAKTDTGLAGGNMLNAADPADAFVFYESPGDFGGMAAVSAKTGLTVFGGTIIWSGTGAIKYPASWRPATDLGNGCAAPSGWSTQSRGWDLAGGGALGAGDVSAALAVVGGTGIANAMASVGSISNSLVLLYPRTVGAFNPANAEWVVVINGVGL